MFVFPDLIVRDTLVEGFEKIQKDPTPIAQIMRNRPQAEIADVQNFFASNDVLPVSLGFARQHPQVPGLYVTLGSSSEEPDYQVIGSEYDQIIENAGEDNEVQIQVTGTELRTVIRIASLSANADLAVYLAAITGWILLRERSSLDNKGLKEQVLSIGDVTPDPQMQPDLVFRRDVSLTCLESASVEKVLDGVTVVGIDVKASPMAPIYPNVPVVIRNPMSRLRTQ